MESRSSKQMWRHERCFVLPGIGRTVGLSSYAVVGRQALEASS
jgi:hypothetical protein